MNTMITTVFVIAGVIAAILLFGAGPIVVGNTQGFGTENKR